MSITQEEIDRGDIVDPDLLEQAQAELEKNDDNDPAPDDDENEELEEEAEDSENDDEEGDDEESGEGDPEDETEDEEQPGAQDEEDPEDEQESDEEAEDSGDEGNRIPLSRLNKALAKNKQAAEALEAEQNRTRWLEQRIEEMIAAKQLPEKDEPVAEPFDFVEAEKNYINLILEGESDKAIELRAEIEEERYNILKEDIASTKDETRTERMAEKEQEAFSVAVDNFENKYPFMDNDHDDYNEEAVDTTNALMQGFMADGKTSRADALAKAVERVAPMYDKKESKTGLGGKKNTARDKETRKKNLKVMKQTPPKNRGKQRKDRSVDDVKPSELSSKEFNSLTKKEKAILRGDVV